VDLAKCDACHTGLAFHGGGRNTTETCVICHNPIRQGGSGETAESVDFRWMIHKIHRGEELTRGYKFGNYDFSEVRFPGRLNNCNMCHVGDSQQLPVKAVRPVVTPKGPLNPTPPTTAACTSCHDSIEAVSHAVANTNAVGESCAVCHGPTSEFSVNKVHTPEVQ
jgi:OmcA/MtrC family decaheme c-type cytochrome